MTISRTTILGFLGTLGLVAILMLLPVYEVYVKSMEGRGEVARAKGQAEANQILAASLKDSPELLKYYSIQSIAQNRKTIYVPTEANVPITEAQKTKAP